MGKKQYSKVRRGAEAQLVRLVDRLIPLLPRWGILVLANTLGWLAWCVPGRHRSVADANLKVIYGDALDAAQRRRICMRHLQVQATTILDLFWFRRDTERRLRRWLITDDAFEKASKIQPTLLITGHLGNWEVLGLRVAMEGVPLVSVARPLKNVAVDRILNEHRHRMGQRVVPREGALRSLVKALRNKERVALVMDQNTLPSEGGAFVPFLGLPAPVSRATGALARIGRSAVIAGAAVLQRDGRYRIVSRPPLRCDLERMSEDRINEYVVASLEDMIRTHPEQWLWSYKRWKYWIREEEAPRYPYYARESPEGAEQAVRG